MWGESDGPDVSVVCGDSLLGDTTVHKSIRSVCICGGGGGGGGSTANKSKQSDKSK